MNLGHWPSFVLMRGELAGRKVGLPVFIHLMFNEKEILAPPESNFFFQKQRSIILEIDFKG